MDNFLDTGASWGSQRDGSHWAQYSQLDLWLATALWHYDWELTGHPLHSPNLMHGDFHPLGLFEKHVAGKRFAKEANVKQGFTSWLQILDLISSTLGNKPWCCGGTNAYMSRPYFLKLLCLCLCLCVCVRACVHMCMM
jgi:glutathione S-transferase